MAEVRLRLGRGAFTLFRPLYPPLLDKEGTPDLKAVRAADSINQSQFPKGNSRETAGRLFAYSRRSSADDHSRLKISGDVHMCVECIELETDSTVLTSWRSSCLETHGKPSLPSNHHFRCQFRRSLHTKSAHGLAHNRLGQIVCFSRAFTQQNNGSPGVPLYKSKSAYYDILKVSPSATQAQIKTAYYKQSFMYHPDKNAGSEDATFHFSQISEAYSVLGNIALRKKYDRGILSQSDLQGSSRPADKGTPTSSGHQTRARHSPSVGADQQKIFDFDAFIRAHYGEQLQREKELRERKEKLLRKQKAHYEDVKLGRLKEITVGMLLAMAVAILFSLKSSK